MGEVIAMAAEAARTGGGPFAAVVVKDGRVVGRGVNRVTADHDPTAHAEVVAIRDACARLETFSLAGAEIFCSCEPCPMCLAAIYWARLDRAWYAGTQEQAAAAGFDDALLYREVALPPEERLLPCRRLLGEAGNTAFRAWLGNTDRVAY